MKHLLLTTICLAVLVDGAAAQHQHQQSPYVDLKTREIKALSDEAIQGYRDGSGMSLALSAELNRYPGPRHVLDLADVMGLDAEQIARVEAIRDAMTADAVRIGAQIVDLERALDLAFAQRTVDSTRLASLTNEIGRLQGELRFVHLTAHLAVTEILSQTQVEEYEMRRGYSGH